MQTLLTILLSLSLAWGCSHFAKKRGRNPMNWFIAGLFFGIFALLALFLMPIRRPEEIKKPDQKSLSPEPPLAVLQPDHIGKLWYFIDKEKKQLGPMSLDALSQAWKEGKVGDKTFVWNEAMDNWRHFQDVIKSTQT
jgi:hypothetical protein